MADGKNGFVFLRYAREGENETLGQWVNVEHIVYFARCSLRLVPRKSSVKIDGEKDVFYCHDTVEEILEAIAKAKDALITELLEALEEISQQYPRSDISADDFRVNAARLADDAIGKVKPEL